MTQLRQVLRRLGRSPGFTAIVVLTLAIGIGATTAIFSVVNGILIKPLPYPESDRLIELVHSSSLQPGEEELPASPAVYVTYRDHNETFDSVALWAYGKASVTGAGEPEEVASLQATHELLPTLRVQPALGRAFTAGDDAPGAAGTVMLSYGYWQRRLGGAETVLGEALIVDGEPYTVIGVLPQGFRFPDQSPEIMTPLQPNPVFVGPLGERGLARLADGVTLAQASADVARMIPILLERFPTLPGTEQTSELAPNLKLLKERVVGDLDELLWVLMGTIGMLLLIACANVANLQLVRTEARGRDLAIRTALGASWRAITGDLLLESLVLGIVGGAAGLALAWLALPVLLAMAAQHLPGVLEITIDATVLVFALLISLVCGLLFGLIPAAKHVAPRAAAALSGSGRSQSLSRERHRARNSLVVAQVALALILLVASGLMIRTFVSLRNVDPGFTEPGTLQTVSITIPAGSVPEFDRVTRMFNDIQDRLSEIAGVEAAGFISELPLMGGPGGPFYAEGNPPVGTSAPSRGFRVASPRLFETLGTPLVAGRDFEWTDHYGERPVVIVSEGMARAEWRTPAAALGQRIRMTPQEPWREVVGVVRDVHHAGLEQPAPDTVYLTLKDRLAPFMSRDVYFVIRSERAGTPGFLEDVQAAIWSVDGTLPLASVRTMSDLYEQSMARTSLTLVLLSITGGMALLLGLVGIYGVISYVLARRAREVGIRVALGAQQGELQRMFLGQCLVLVGAGAALGLGGAAVLTRLMESQLFGVDALDPATYAVVAAILVATAMLAGVVPLRRLTRVDPMDALRAE